MRVKRIRPFLGAKDFDLSRAFYRKLGFREVMISPSLSAFHAEDVWFYLQDHYVKEWAENTMVFLEVPDLDDWFLALQRWNLPVEFPGTKLSSIREEDWGREFFLHDPAGNLWHIGSFES